ncbi:MAG: hypothetical protein AMJ91_00795 [candidate division Zixibacteria bacterium SM23_73_3]|nr:MAG: hypothetical protein AMJ91_00795 [candidate division Zixibacteria bacterium SM23_73_3]
MKIRDYLGIDSEKEAELKKVVTFFPESNIHKPNQKEMFSPFEKAVIERIFPRTKEISKGTIPYPAIAGVYLSYTCNHNCSGCPCGHNHKRENAFMGLNGFSKLLNALHFLRVKFIDLSGGGEPTLHPEFSKFAQMCIKEKFELSLLTNGTSFDPKIVDFLIEGFSFLRVNLDASNDGVYDRIHHPPTQGEFRKVLGNLERIVSQRERKKSDLVVGARVRLCQTNMNFIEEMTCLAKDMGLDYIQFRVNQNAFDPLLSEQKREVYKLIKELKNSYHPFEVYGEIETGKSGRGCWLSPLHLIIDPVGDVYPCPHFVQHPEIISFGNILAWPADRLWFGPVHRRVVEQWKKNDCHLKDCRGHTYNDFMRLSAGR